MAIALKCLAQAIAAALVQSTLYTVPGATSAVASTITICNQSLNPTTFRVAVQIAGAAISTGKEYIFFDAPIAGKQTQTYTIGMTLAATDIVSVQSANGLCSFNLFGQENS